MELLPSYHSKTLGIPPRALLVLRIRFGLAYYFGQDSLHLRHPLLELGNLLEVFSDVVVDHKIQRTRLRRGQP